MVLLLDGGVESEMLDKLIKAYNDIEEKGAGSLHIFFQSEGGENPAGEAMISLINRNSNITTITAHGLLASMGFIIFAKCTCTKIVLDTCYAIVHLTRWSNHTLEGGKFVDDFGRFKQTHMKKKLPSTVKFYKDLGFSKQEIEQMKKGEDLYLDAQRVQKMFE